MRVLRVFDESVVRDYLLEHVVSWKLFSFPVVRMLLLCPCLEISVVHVLLISFPNRKLSIGT
jgi:hypothetical protein